MVTTPSSNERAHQGVWCFSLDTELAWGVLEYPGFAEYRKRFDQARSVIDRMCLLFDQFRIPVSWAIVGRLLQQPEDLTQSDYPQLPDGTRPGDAPHHFHLPDIIRRIQSSSVGHEICSHSLTHLRFSERTTTRECVRRELAELRKVTSARNLNPTSFIFPYNAEGFHDELVRAGFRAFRGRTPQWYDAFGGVGLRAGHFVDQLAGIAPRIGVTQRHPSGLWNIPATAFLMPLRGARGIGGIRSRVRKIRAGIERLGEGGLFHLWSHPHNFFGEPDRMLELLERVLTEVAGARDCWKIRTLTMGNIADELDAA